MKNIQVGDKTKVTWNVKDANAKDWENVTVEPIRCLSETETILFVKEFPICAVNSNRVEKLN